MSIDLPEADLALALFGETNGCFLVEVSADLCTAFEASLASPHLTRIGAVTQDPDLSIRIGGKPAISISVEELLAAWKTHQ